MKLIKSTRKQKRFTAVFDDKKVHFGSKKGSTYIDQCLLLPQTHLMREFLLIDKTKGLTSAVKGRSMQDQGGHNSKRQAKGGFTSSEHEPNY